MSGSRPRLSTAERSRWIRNPVSVSGRTNFTIVAIGASAGGLEACKKLLDALPERNDMAFVIVQHLDPSHDSLLVELLAAHTSMNVVQATDGMEIERERVCVIRLACFSRSTKRERCASRARWSVTGAASV